MRTKRRTSTLGEPITLVQLDWYRSWRVLCCQERERSNDERRAREADVVDATRLVPPIEKR
jgi:hypothetical protein